MHKHVLVLAIFAALATGRRVSAQESAPGTLDTVIVSATKAETSRAPATQSVTVISGAELRATGVTRISDALRLVPGTAIVTAGSHGAVSSLFLRGGESRYAKVLIDGVPVNAVGGYFDFSHLTSDNVERVEIVRGPGSVVYGADAMTGVIHIFTRRAAGPSPASVEAGVRAGTHATRDMDLAVRGASAFGPQADRAPAIQYSLAGARHSTDGILPFNNGYYNGTVSGAASVSPDEATQLSVAARYTDAEFHYPTDFSGVVGDSNSYRDQHRLTISGNASRRLAQRISLRLIGGTNDVGDITDDIEPGFCPGMCIVAPPQSHTRFLSRTRRRNAEARLGIDLPRGVLTTGVEYVRERERTVSSEAAVGAPLVAGSRFAGTRITRTAFAEVGGGSARGGGGGRGGRGGRGGWVDYSLSARLDDPSDFDLVATYRAGVVVGPGRVRLRANTGTAFNAPSFAQLLPTDFTIGNPSLKPERARSWDLGLEHNAAGGRARVSATYFDQTFEDLIQYVPGGPPTFRGSYANLAEATSRGWEFDSRVATTGGWLFGASATLLSARISELDPGADPSLQVGQRLVRRPRRSASGSATYVGSSRGSAGVAMRHVGSREDFDFRQFPSPLVRMPAHTVLDLSGQVRPWGGARAAGLALTARVENALDKQYEEVLYYAAPGRTVLIGARLELNAP